MDLLRPKLTILQEQMNMKYHSCWKKEENNSYFYVNKIYLR